MMTLTITTTYSCRKYTCGELSDMLAKSGNIQCMPYLYIEKTNDEPTPILQSWPWIQAQRRNKKLLVLSDEHSKAVLLKCKK